MINIALLSRWHVHSDEYANYAKENKNVKISIVWDEEPERGKKWASELGVPFESNINRIMDDKTIDAVIVSSPTNMHKKIIRKALNKGKHVFCEKVLAFTARDCNKLYNLADKMNKKLLVSLPKLMEPYYAYVESAINNGLVGEISLIRCRVAHDGALASCDFPNGWLPSYFFDKKRCGGGALIDYGAHPIYLLNRIGGTIQSVYADLGRFLNRSVDDNSTVLVKYESGITGIIEASYVTRCCPFMMEVFGSEGVILIEGKELKIRSIKINNGEWTKPELPVKGPSAIEQWIGAMEENVEPLIKKMDVIKLSEINELAVISYKYGKKVSRKKYYHLRKD